MHQNRVLRHPHGGHLGSIVLTTGDSNISQGYYAYGRFRSGGPLLTDQSFTGQKFDRVPTGRGLFYYNSRYYDPQLGIFLSPDTLVPDATTLFDYNRYMYVRGNPLLYNDPTGHCPVCVVLVLAAIAIGVEGSVAQSPAGGYVDTPPNANGRLAVSLVAGDANDLAIVATGYDYINQEEVPYLSEGYVNALGAAVLPLISHSSAKIADEILEGATDAAKAVSNPFDDLAQMRQSLGLGDTDVLARLDINGQTFYGVNGPGVQHAKLPGVTYQSLRHAEGDAFSQAITSGIRGGEATLYVDTTPCGWCRSSLAGYAKNLGLDKLNVFTPDGLYGWYDSAIGRFILASN